ncbi:DUF1344 domain-containing protein, partial [Mesorhizobium sp. M7A.F.Ca.CA.004.06.2.1]|uniref:DUF1344 domain-containing protein n=1 Tax=Mesorhizobium sp. M7A.F.Ca.CA.004.06.2.1 TaxID=2496687 RepID=UPI001FE2208D
PELRQTKRAATRRDRTAQTTRGTSLRGMPYFQEYFAMRKIIVSAAAAALLASGSVAFAAVKHTTGTIKTFDATAMSLVLDDGSSFTLPKTFKDPGLQVGEKVRVSWDMKGKNKVAEAVKAAK